MSACAQLVRLLWDRVEARDWDAARDVLTEDFVCEWPATRERFEGRDNYIAMNREYPEGWSIEVLDVVGEGDRATSLVRVPHGDAVFYAASFYEADGDRLARLVELWVTEGAEAPPAWRQAFTAR